MADPYGYDELPYPSAPYPYTHPDHLSTLATLFGWQTGWTEEGRVLEVGCADGANLLSMALTMPQSHFVGIDLAQNQIAAGQRLASRLGLGNVELVHGDLADLTVDEPFDWIIAHGFYSWTPPDTRSRLLEICQQHLKPHGVAFVSYNVLPGWQLRLAVRRWLLPQMDRGRTTAERLQLARSALGTLSNILAGTTGTQHFQDLLVEVKQLARWSDAYLRHDLLEDFNEPVLFSDFAAHARQYGLKFFAEADFATMTGKDLPAAAAARLMQLPSRLTEREQLIDLLTKRPFRQSLLCREEQHTREQVGPDVVRDLYAVSTLQELARPTSAELSPPTFRSRTGFEVAAKNPVCREALRELAGCWPVGQFVSELTKSARDRVKRLKPHSRERDLELDLDDLCAILLAGFAERCVELHSRRPPFAATPPVKPKASPLVRAQVESQSWVSSLRHDLVQVTDKQRLLLRFLDGTRSSADLLQTVTDMPRHAELEPRDEVIDESWIDGQVHWSARQGLLMPHC